MIRRRAFLELTAGVVAALHSGLPLCAQPSSARKSRLILLGTGGGPTPKPGRSAPAQAIIVNDATYLIDCGNGVAAQMAKAHIKFSSLRDIFITHLHSDHVADYGNVLLLGWETDLVNPVNAPRPA